MFVLKAFIALSTFGSTDALIFESDLAKLARDGGLALYRDGIQTEWCGQVDQRPCPPFIHPPFMIHALSGWAFLAQISGLPLRFWLRFTCAMADLGSLALLSRPLREQLGESQARLALLWFATSPIAILISGFHGNTDPILIFFLLLALGLLERQRTAGFAGVAFGMATNIKVLPLLIAPAVLLSLPGTRRLLEFCAGVGAALVLGSLPFLTMAPELIVTRVFGYASQSGSWGLSLLALFMQENARLSWLGDLYLSHGKILSLCVVVGASIWLRALPRRNGLFMQTGFLMFLFVSVIPGFGVQYLAWLVPWVVVLGSRPTAIYYAAGTAFLFAYYSTAAGQFPWYFANSLARPAWTATVVGLGLICWVVVCSIALNYARRLGTTRIDSRREQ